MQRKHFGQWELVLCLAVVGSAFLIVVAQGGAGRDGPRTMHDVLQAARRCGLHSHQRHAGGDASGDALTLSDAPLTAEQAGSLRLGNLASPEWIGRVRVHECRRRDCWIVEPPPAAVWGNFALFGDRALIERLLHTTHQ